MLTKRIENAINIFLDAINNGTLAKGTCVACAVGNLAANALGGTITKDSVTYNCDMPNYIWSRLFYTDDGEQINWFEEAGDKEHETFVQAIKVLEKTDFSIEELMAIEFAFETNTTLPFQKYYLYSAKEIRADQIKGLEAVVKVMMEFDNCPEPIREVFTNKAELIAI